MPTTIITVAITTLDDENNVELIDAISDAEVLAQFDAIIVAETEATIRESISDEVVIVFDYVKLDGSECVRTLSPWEVKTTRTGPVVVGFDHDRQDVRQFALDRIGYVEVESAQFVPPVRQV